MKRSLIVCALALLLMSIVALGGCSTGGNSNPGGGGGGGINIGGETDNQGNQQGDTTLLFPVTTGSTWTYQYTENGQTKQETRTMLGTEDFRSVGCYALDYSNATEHFKFFFQKDNSLRFKGFVNLTRGQTLALSESLVLMLFPATLIDENINILTYIDNASIYDTYNHQTVSTYDTVDTPSGIFPGCVNINWANATYSEMGSFQTWYAPGVGVVKEIRSFTFGGTPITNRMYVLTNRNVLP